MKLLSDIEMHITVYHFADKDAVLYNKKYEEDGSTKH